MKRYRLLKDLPGVKAGEIFTYYNSGIDGYLRASDGFGGAWFREDTIKNSPDWFAPVDERWRPGRGDSYFYVGSGGDIGCSYAMWLGKGVVWERFNFGNCFRTREAAESAAQKIRELLMEIKGGGE